MSTTYETTARAFDLGDVLTVTTGRLLSPRHMDGVYDILGFLTGDTLWTHELPDAGEHCRELVLDQHPELRKVVVPAKFPEPKRESVLAWLDEMKRLHGETIKLRPVGGWVRTASPIETLADKVGTDRIIVV